MKAATLTALGMLMLPSGASGAVVSADVRYSSSERISFGPVSFKAGRGEANRLTITRASRRAYLFRDTGARLSARGDCRAIGPHKVRCPRTTDRMQVRLRDRGDSLRADIPAGGDTVDVDAGGGNDVLRGGEGFDRLTGGPGRDTLHGRGGTDELYDGETDRQAAPDRFVGGSADSGGSDLVEYGQRRRGLRIDMRSREVNREGDRFTGIEALEGGSGDDSLAGNGNANRLWGGAGDDSLRASGGRDVVDGGAGDDVVNGGAGDDFVWGDFATSAARSGDDVLYGGPGEDTVKGNKGNDRVVTRGTHADSVSCGGGSPVADVAVSDRFDFVTGCDYVEAGELHLVPRPRRVEPRRITFAISCNTPRGCRGRLELSGADGQEYGSEEFDISGIASAEVTVELNDAGAAALDRGPDGAASIFHMEVVPADSEPGVELGGYARALAVD